MTTRWIVSQQERGISLGQYTQDRLQPAYSKRRIKQILEANCCKVNGHIQRRPSYTLASGDVIELQDPPEERGIPACALLYTDENISVIDKPAGLTTEQCLQECLSGQHFPVHRLDKDTSGVLLFARTELAKRAYERLFAERAMQKTYLALVDGVPTYPSGSIENTLGPLHKRGNFAVWGEVPKEKGGVDALTDWELVDVYGTYSCLLCFPKTGRTHQIRIHLALIGHPILGDTKYGLNHHFSTPLQPSRCLLHASRLAFEDQLTGQARVFVASLPKDMQVLLKKDA